MFESFVGEYIYETLAFLVFSIPRPLLGAPAGQR
jgi:hypothetical protein